MVIMLNIFIVKRRWGCEGMKVMVLGIGVRKVVLESLEEGWEEKVRRKTPMAFFLNLPKLWANTWVDESHGGGEGRKGEERKAKTLYLTSHTLYGQHLPC